MQMLQEEGCRFLYMGDSIMRRLLNRVFGIEEQRAPAGQRLCGLCLGGQRVGQLRRRLRDGRRVVNSQSRWHVTLQPVDTIVLLIGTNDCLNGQTIGRFREDFMWLLLDLRRELQYRRIVMCSIPPLRDHSVSVYNEVIRSIAHQRNAVFVDAYEVFQDRTEALMEVDGVHPNYDGLCAILAAIVLLLYVVLGREVYIIKSPLIVPYVVLYDFCYGL